MFGKSSILKRFTKRSGLAAATLALATAFTGTNASAEGNDSHRFRYGGPLSPGR